MASDRVRQILRAKGAQLTDAEIAGMTDREAWAWLYEHFPPASTRPTRNPGNRPEICITGFSAGGKAELADIAEAAGYWVATKVAQNVTLLVAGPNAGPTKLRDAELRGIKILDAGAFLDLVGHPHRNHPWS